MADASARQPRGFEGQAAGRNRRSCTGTQIGPSIESLPPRDRARLRKLSNLQDRSFKPFDETKMDIAPVSRVPFHRRAVLLFGERVEAQIQHYGYLARVRARTCSPRTPRTVQSSISASRRSASSIHSSRIVSGSTNSRLRTRAYASRQRAYGASPEAAFSISSACIFVLRIHQECSVCRLSCADKRKSQPAPRPAKPNVSGEPRRGHARIAFGGSRLPAVGSSGMFGQSASRPLAPVHAAVA